MASGNDLKAYWPMPDFFLHDADASTRMTAWLALPALLRQDVVRMSELADKGDASWGTSFRHGTTGTSSDDIVRLSTLPQLKRLVEGNHQLKASFAASLANSEAAARRLLGMLGTCNDGVPQGGGLQQVGPISLQCNVCQQTIGPQEGYVAYQRSEPPYEEYGHTCGECQLRRDRPLSQKAPGNVDAKGRRALHDHRMDRPVRVLEHSAVCRNPDCPSNSCRRVKAMHEHVQACTNSHGKCQDCNTYFYLLKLHAVQCAAAGRQCPVPWCWELREVFLKHGADSTTAGQAAAPTSNQSSSTAPAKPASKAQGPHSAIEGVQLPIKAGSQAPTAPAMSMGMPAAFNVSPDASMLSPQPMATKSEALLCTENQLDAEMTE